MLTNPQQLQKLRGSWWVLPSSVCVLTCKQMGMQPCLTQTSLLIENFPCDLEAEVGNGRYSAQPQSLLMWVSGQATTYSQAL